jgi:hypothetical protein
MCEEDREKRERGKERGGGIDNCMKFSGATSAADHDEWTLQDVR